MKFYISADKRNIVYLIAGLILLGLMLFLFNRDMPIVRNSLVYARMSYHLLDGVPLEGTYEKPIGFSVLSLPFVKWFEANIGLKTSSFLWTSLWIISLGVCLALRRKNEEKKIVREKGIPLVLLICFFNPLVMYQFFSAYPGTLFALVFLWEVYFMDRMLSKNVRLYDGVIFSFAALLGIWVKHQGYVIFPIFAVFLLCRTEILKYQWDERKKEMAVWVCLSLALVIFSCWIRSGRFAPFFDATNGIRQQGGINRIFFLRNIKGIWVFLVLVFGPLIPFLSRWKNFLINKEWYFLVLFFVVAVLLLDGADYNIRYYLAVIPLFSLLIFQNLKSVHKIYSWLVLTLFVLINSFLVGYYNVSQFHGYFKHICPLRQFDNLRLTTEQTRVDRSLQAIHERGQTSDFKLHFVSSYYGDGAWYIWERSGLFPKNLEITYDDKINRDFFNNKNSENTMVYLFWAQYCERSLLLPGNEVPFKKYNLSKEGELYLPPETRIKSAWHRY